MQFKLIKMQLVIKYVIIIIYNLLSIIKIVDT